MQHTGQRGSIRRLGYRFGRLAGQVPRVTSISAGAKIVLQDKWLVWTTSTEHRRRGNQYTGTLRGIGGSGRTGKKDRILGTGSCEEIDRKDSIALLRNLRRPVHCMCDKRFETAFSATGFH